MVSIHSPYFEIMHFIHNFLLCKWTILKILIPRDSNGSGEINIVMSRYSAWVQYAKCIRMHPICIICIIKTDRPVTIPKAKGPISWSHDFDVAQGSNLCVMYKSRFEAFFRWNWIHIQILKVWTQLLLCWIWIIEHPTFVIDKNLYTKSLHSHQSFYCGLFFIIITTA